MPRFNGNQVGNPAAYDAARRANIHQNANQTRRRTMVAAMVAAGDSDDFQSWVMGEEPESITELRERQSADDVGDGSWTPAVRAYQTAMQAFWKRHGSLPDALRDALQQWGGLSPKQLQWARDTFRKNTERSDRLAAARAEQAANAPAWAAGRQTITATLASTREVESEYGTTLKGMFVLADGRRVWATVPRGLTYENKGDTVTMKVTIAVSDDDASMAFGSRPTLTTE